MWQYLNSYDQRERLEVDNLRVADSEVLQCPRQWRFCGSCFATIEVVQWSKLRSSVRSLICEELRTRVDFQVTSYHGRRSARARSGEITVDGKPVLELSYDRFCRESDGWFASIRGGEKYGSWGGPASAETVWSEHQSDEIHPPQQLGDAMRAYLSMPVDEALTSANPFIRALAIIDRRVGRRTLEALHVEEEAHSLVREFYRLRMKALSSKRD